MPTLLGKTRILVLILSSFLFPTIACAQVKSADTVQKVIVDFFEVLSIPDSLHLTDFVTNDVMVLENGAIWTLDSLQEMLSKPRPADFKRTNSFDFLTTELSETLCSVAYHNKAIVLRNGQLREVAWLESAVLIRDKDRWKIKLLHSTRLYNKKVDK